MKSSGRVILSILILGFIGLGLYFGAIKALDIYNKMEKSSLKKIISVKPKNIKRERVLEDSWSLNEDKFTFFDILNDPSMSKFIDLNENITKSQKITSKKPDIKSKIKVRPILQSDNVGTKNILIPSTHKVETQNPAKPLVSGFILQVGSFKKLERANFLKNNLAKKGYPAFLMVAQLSGEDEMWHRVVIGRFTQKEAAVKTAIRIKQIENLESVIKKVPRTMASP